ncbi:uncharacterized protein LOC144146165 [Haemaphysalis longicornis]
MKFKITNRKVGDIVRYPLALLCGVCPSDEASSSVFVANCSSENPDAFTSWPLIDGKFKFLVLLVLGKNELVLKSEETCQSFTLVFEPLSSFPSNYIRLVYVLCRDAPDEGHFQGPQDEDCSVESARDRIALGMQLLQMTMSESLAASGMSGKSFRLEQSKDFGKPLVHVFRSKLCYDEAIGMTAEDVWSYVATELMNSELRDGDRCKFVAFLSWTRYQAGVEPKTHGDVLSRTSGHVMIGAGGLALCGTGCLYTWARSIEELSQRLYDSRLVDRLRFMDDSNYRGTLSACYSSSLGGVLHEMGHTFGLGHTAEGIMGHGFHDIAHVYTVSDRDVEDVWGNFRSVTVEAAGNGDAGAEGNSGPSRIRLTTLKPKPQPGNVVPHRPGTIPLTSGATWSRSCAIILDSHPWLNTDRSSNVPGTIELQSGGRLTSPHGIRLLELRRIEDGMVVAFWEFPDAAPEVCIRPSKLKSLPCSTSSQWQDWCEGEDQMVHVFALDTAGNTLGKDVCLQELERE